MYTHTHTHTHIYADRTCFHSNLDLESNIVNTYPPLGTGVEPLPCQAIGRKLIGVYRIEVFRIRPEPDYPAGTWLSGQNYENPAGLSGRIFSHDVSSREPPKDRVVPLRSRPQDQTIGSNHKLRLVLVMLISSNSQIQGIFHSLF